MLERPSLQDQVTPYKMTLLVLVEQHRLCWAAKSVINPDVYSEKEDRELMITLLGLVQTADLELKEMMFKIANVLKPTLMRNFSEQLRNLSTEEVGAVMDLFQTLPINLFQEPKPLLHKCSVLGFFVRRILLAFDKLSFSQVAALHNRYKAFYSQWGGSKNDCTRPDSQDVLNTSNMSESSISFMELASDDEENTSKQSALDTSVTDVGSYSKRQAEFFIAKQAALLQHNEMEALSPRKLQQRIMELLQSSPQLAEAHYLSYLNYLRVNEYCGAVESLHHYFDCHLVDANKTNDTAKPKQEDEVICKGFRYAALSMAALQYRFGHRAEAFAAVCEAVRMAQETNDNVCLQHALGWLQRLGIEESWNTTYVLDRLVTKAGELNLAYLTSLGVQAFAKHNSLTATQPSSVFEFLLKSDIVNCQHSMIDLMCTSYAQKAALWHMYGRREMSSLNCQMLLHLNTLELGVYRNGEAECLALSHLARLHALQGEFHKASEIVQVTKKRYPPSSQNAPVWKLCEQLLLFDQAVHHGDWTAADQAVVNMASANSSEATYSECVLLLRKGEISEAFKRVEKLIKQHSCHAPNQAQPDMHARLLMLQSDLHCASGNYPAAGPPLMHCLALCKKHNFSYLVAMATMSLAFVQFCLGMPRQALLLIEGALVPILSYNCLFDHARALYLYTRCAVAAATLEGATKKKAALLSGIQTLAEVIQWFKEVEAYQRTKDAIYYQVRLYNELGYVTERNRCALEFHQLDQQYPTRTSALVNTL
ncbi:Anaphase-promoting complex subunit 5 [Lamellibrachia satsuma]|nr:Anaphase-promoting complex subunit 5 [Lamellibrachia satsuma]